MLVYKYYVMMVTLDCLSYMIHHLFNFISEKPPSARGDKSNKGMPFQNEIYALSKELKDAGHLTTSSICLYGLIWIYLSPRGAFMYEDANKFAI